MFFVTFFCYVFQTPLLPTFWSQRHPPAPIWSPFGYQVDDISNKSGKVATAFSLEKGHQNQVVQGLDFTIIHHFCFWYVLPRPVMFTIHRRHYAQYPQFMDSFGYHFKLIFAIFCTSILLRFFDILFFQNEISARHLRHNGGKGGTGRHLGGTLDSRRPWRSRMLQITKIDSHPG